MKQIIKRLKSPFRIAQLIGLLSAGVIFVAFQNCDNVRLSLFVAPKVAALSTGQYCNLNITVTPGVKFYLAVDVTGSNVSGDVTDDGVQVPATDPGKPLRLGALNGLANKFPGAQYAVRTFAGDGTNDPFRSSYYPFVTQSNFLSTTIPAFTSVLDQGGTNYEIILTQIAADIRAYLTAQLALPVAEQDPPGPIVILFGSDGIPHYGCKAQACFQTLVDAITSLPASLNATQIVPYISGDAFGWGGIFGPAGAASDEAQYLQDVAQAFGGAVVIDQAGQPLDLTQLPLPDPESPQGVNMSLFATNLNGVWEPTADGLAQFNLDSDGDGLGDAREAVFGSNPSAYDSDGNGLGDGVETYVWGTPCQDPACAPPTVEKRAAVKNCNQIPAADGGAAGSYTNDLLNNCEKIAVGADYHFFSYLKDDVPDGVKVRNNLSPTDTALNQVNVGNGNLTMIQKMKMNLPTFIPDPIGAGIKPTTYDIQFTGTQNGTPCYNFNIQGLPTAGTAPNKVRLWLVQTQSNAPDILRTADIMVTPGQPVSLTNVDFKPNQSDVDQNGGLPPGYLPPAPSPTP